MDDKLKLLDFFIAEITEDDEIINCGNNKILRPVNRW
jgi:hypothetical protein